MSLGHRDGYYLVVILTDGGMKGKEEARVTPSNGVNGSDLKTDTRGTNL